MIRKITTSNFACLALASLLILNVSSANGQREAESNTKVRVSKNTPTPVSPPPIPSGANFECGPGRVLQQVNTWNRVKRCIDLPEAPTKYNFECGEGRFLQQVNTYNGEKRCGDLPASFEEVSCPDGKVLTGISSSGEPVCKEAGVDLYACHRVQQDNYDHCSCPPGEVMTMHNADATGNTEYNGFTRPVHPSDGQMFYQANCDCCKIRIRLQ